MKSELEKKIKEAQDKYNHCLYMLNSGKSEDGHEADIMEYLNEEINDLESQLENI